MQSIFNDANFLNFILHHIKLNHTVVAECNISTDEFERLLNIKRKSNDFIILNYNVRSLNNRDHFDSLLDFLASIKANGDSVDCIIVTETWANSFDMNNGQYDIPGFNLLFDCRENRRGGGVAMYISNNYNISQISLRFSHSNAVGCLLKYKNAKGLDDILMLVGIYRPPDADVDLFLTELAACLNTHCNITAIVAGDINIDISSKSHVKTNN